MESEVVDGIETCHDHSKGPEYPKPLREKQHEALYPILAHPPPGQTKEEQHEQTPVVTIPML